MLTFDTSSDVTPTPSTISKVSGSSATYMILLGALVPLVYPFLKSHGIIPGDWTAHMTADKVLELAMSVSAAAIAFERILKSLLLAYHPAHKTGEPLIDLNQVQKALDTAQLTVPANTIDPSVRMTSGESSSTT